MIETVPCDQGCGAQLFAFAGVNRCPECNLKLQRAEIPEAVKAAEWDAAMEWLDGHATPMFLSDRFLTLKARLEEMWRALDD